MNTLMEQTTRLLELLGHDETPLGVHYAEARPEGFGPRAGEIFSREREAAGAIDWPKAFGDFSCIVGNVWLARKKRKPAWISHEECGCMGGGYYAGMYAPYVEMIVSYVSTGIPGTAMEGEHYMPSPEAMRHFLEEVDPPSGLGRYCVIKPLELFAAGEEPLVVAFFVRPEVLTGLHSLVGYATGGLDAVRAPFGAGCTNIITWPLTYQRRGQECAVLGGFDPSARKFMKPDELTFAVPLSLYRKMLAVMETSALTRHTWAGVRKKVEKSRRAWGEAAQEDARQG
ncbi:DUF169 domain-containing protein [Desulfocurvus vexinensis]|uniref:DUF169 domain-containing protein n=1 Tax=Desulfocurvus vexinensis TaxID=399548 RepID=UPI00049021F9|nr:DUF169 domain-containing protein [Desulfocurvus vexinensis]